MTQSLRAFRLVGTSLLVAGVTLAAATCGGEKIFSPPEPASISVAAGDAQSGTAGAALATQVTVTVKDSHGTGVAGVTVQWTVTSGGGSVTGSASPVRAPGMAGGSANSVTANTATSTTGATGTAAAVWTLGTTAGPNTLQASLPSSTGISPIHFSATGLPGAASQLVLTTAAAGAASGSPFATQPAVAVQDANGNTLTGDDSTVVTMTVSTGATIVGTDSATASSGVATFSGLGVSGVAGTAYTLTFGSGTLTSATQSVTPTAGSPAQLELTTAPAGAASGAAFGTQPVVTVRDAVGNQVTSDNSTVVTMTVSGSASVVGSATATAVGGVATFSGVGISGTAGTAYTLTFSSGTLTSATASITPAAGAPAALVLTRNAAGAASGAAFGTQPIVTVEDGTGNPVTSDNTTMVRMTVSAGATVVGTDSAKAASGVATFSGVGISGTAGTAYTLTFGSGSLTPATQSITPSAGAGAKLVLTTLAAGAASGAAFATQPVVTEQDAGGNTISADNTSVVTMTVSTGASVVGTATATVSSGVATFTDVGITGTAGTAYTLTFGSPSLTSATQQITAAVGPVSTSMSTVTVSSPTVASGSSLTLTLQAKDAAGNDLSAGGLTVAFTNSGGTSTGTIGATTDNGDGTYTATFTGATAGTATTIHATIGGNDVTSTPLPTVTVTTAAASTSTSTVSASGSTVASGSDVTLTLQAKDAGGNNLTTGGLMVAFTASTGAGVSTGTISATTDNGDGTYTATFTGALAGSATTIGATIGGTAVTSTPLPTVTVTTGPISASTSTVSVSSPTVASGSSVTLTLQAKDAGGNTLTAGGATVVFTASGGGSTGTIGSTTDNGDGTYTATFTGVLAGSATTIGATIGGTDVTTTLPTVTVTAGTASTATSAVTVSSPTVASGSDVTLTLQAKDAAGNNLSSGGLTVAFTSSGGTSTGTIGATTDNGDGTYTATFTGATVGTATTIGATIGGTAVTSTPLPTVTVTAGAASTSTSTVSVSSDSVASGSDVTLTLQAKDAAGNDLAAGGLTVAFTASTGAGVSTGTIGATTDNGDGTYTATFTGVLVGSATTIGATIGGTAVTTTLPTVTVTPGAASVSTSTVSVSNATVASGSSVTLTLQANDAAGNSLTAGGATVVFNASGGTSTGTVGATTDNGDGTYTASFTGGTAGTATTIGATIGGSAVTTTLPTVTVTPGSVSVSMSTVSVANDSVASGNSVALTLQAKDGAGNNLPAGGLTVAFTASTGAGVSTGTFSGTTDNGDGTYTATFTGGTAGTPTTIGATIGGSAVTSTLPTVTVTPGPVSVSTSTVSVSNDSVASGGSVTLTLQAKDAAGNDLPAGGLTVVFNASGGTSTGTIGATTDNGDGTYTATFTGGTAGTATTIGATIGGSAVTSTLPTVTVTPGAASVTTSTVSVSSATVASGDSITLTLQAKDAAGNSLATGGLTVAFTATTGAGVSTGTIGATTDNNDGTYTAWFKGAVAGTATSIGATIGGTTVTTTSPTVTVQIGTASPDSSTVSVSGDSVASGSTLTVTLQAKDYGGNSLTTGGATVVFTTSAVAGQSTGTFGATTDNGDGTYTATFTGVLIGTPVSIGATIGGVAVTTTLPTVTVTVGPVSTANSVVTASASTVQAGDSILLTLQAKDSAGNNLTASVGAVAFSFSDGVSTGFIRPVVDSANGKYIAYLLGQTAGTASTVHATIGGLSVTTTSPALPTVQVNLGPISDSTSTITVSADSVYATDSVLVTLQLKDPGRNNLTTSGQTVAFSTSGGTSIGTFGTVADNGNGTYEAWFTGVTAGTATTMQATIGGSAVTTTTPPPPTVFVKPAAAGKLVFTVQPTSGQIGAPVGDVTVQVQDGSGTPLTTFDGDVQLALASPSGNPRAALSATSGLTVHVTSGGTGNAVFTGVSVDMFGRGYQLVASSPTLVATTSAAFNDTLAAAFYVTDSAGGTVSLVDSATNSVNDVINLGSSSAPWGVAVTADRKWAYVSLNGTGQVAVIDVGADTVYTYITVGTRPAGVSLDPSGSILFVANYSGGTMSAIDVGSNTVVATAPAGASPRRLIARANQVWIANDNPILTLYARGMGSDTLSDTVSTVGVSHNFWDIAARPTSNSRYLYLTIPALDSVYVVDTADAAVGSIVKFGVTGAPSGIAFSSDGSSAFISNASAGTVSQIDATAATPTVTNASWASGLTDPETMITSPSGTLLYVANRSDGTVSVFNIGTGAAVATINTGGQPRSMAFLP